MELSRRTGYGPAMRLQRGMCERELPGNEWPEPVETLTLQSKDGIGENGKNNPWRRENCTLGASFIQLIYILLVSNGHEKM